MVYTLANKESVVLHDGESIIRNEEELKLVCTLAKINEKYIYIYIWP